MSTWYIILHCILFCKIRFFCEGHIYNGLHKVNQIYGCIEEGVSGSVVIHTLRSVEDEQRRYVRRKHFQTNERERKMA